MTSVLRFLFLFAMATPIAIPALAQDSAESKRSTGEPEKLVVSTFKEGMAKARKIGKPLVIFGLSDT